MKNQFWLLFLLFMLPACLFSQTNNFKFKKTTSFFPNEKNINRENVEWGYLIVPENWNKPEGKTIKIAVVIIKSKSKNIDSNPVIYIPGGPGAGGIRGIRGWLQHPLRKNDDIVLMDVRGTGFSFPKLCPDLGEIFLEILSKNQNSTQDEQQKAIAAAECKQDLISRGIDINAYNSESIAKDLNALKKALKYKKWNVYGVSYGTYTAQVYANDFPQDIKSLILDSSISDITQYYNHNTTNYINSLKKIFEACKKDSVCNMKYPNLERTYYATIEKFAKNPVTVIVDKKIIPSGKFTYNAEDFKISIQQALYNKKLIRVIPMLIVEFNRGNKNTLSSLVVAFSRSLGLDYGQYYCVSCNEAIPYNSISTYDKDALEYKKLKGGLSFYRSDFLICDKWNIEARNVPKVKNDLSNLSTLTAPVLVFSGGFDPIIPASNGKITVDKFKNGFLVNAPVFGHAPSFSKVGSKIVNEFINNSDQIPNVNGFQLNNKVNFVTDTVMCGGVSNFANSLNEFNFLFFVPLLIALTILLISFFSFIYLFIKRGKVTIPNKLIRILIVITFLLGLFTIIGFIVAIKSTVNDDFYILAFGVPDRFEYLLVVQRIFVLFTLISISYFVLKIKSISNTSVIATILFSLFLIVVYFQYWGFLF